MKEPYERDEAIAQGGPSAHPGPANIKERIYEKLRMPLWVLDAILILLGLGVVVAVVLGMIRGRVG